MEYDVDKILSEQFARMGFEKPERKLVLHREPAPLRRWVIAASGIAAAVIVTVAVFVAPERSHSADILCVVNGVHVTDPCEIAIHTREALEIAADNLRRPGKSLSAELGGDPSLARVGEMLNELTKMN